MSKGSFPEEKVIQEKETTVIVRKGRLDLVVLRFMAKKVAVTLRALEQDTESPLPLSYSFDELRGRQHRMVIFAPHALLASENLRFVGFVSSRSRAAEQAIIDEIQRADGAMLAGLAHIPGLLSYSSLELHPGNWYNLVVFREAGVKMHVKSMETHRHAVYKLSPAYYEWIRLHNGAMPTGLASLDLQLISTKYYAFSGSQQPPVVRELNYEPWTDAC